MLSKWGNEMMTTVGISAGQADRNGFASRLWYRGFLHLLTALLLVQLGCGSDPMAEFESAVKSYNKKNPVAARSKLRRTTALQPDFAPAYLLLGRIALQLGDENLARLHYSNAFGIMSDRGFKLREEDLVARNGNLRLEWQEAAFFLADSEFQGENYSRATEYYDKILSHDESTAWKQKAFDSKEVMRDFSAYKAKLKALRSENYQHSDDPRIKAEMAALFMDMAAGISRLGKLKSVADYIGMSTEFRNQASENLARLYEASAERYLPQTEGLLAYTESQESLMRGNPDRALEKAKEACEKDPASAKYQFAVANILQVIADRDKGTDEGTTISTDEIIAYARKAAELEPRVWRYLVYYAGRLQELGQLKDSYDVLLKVRDVTGDKDVLAEVEGTLASLEEAMRAEQMALDAGQR